MNPLEVFAAGVVKLGFARKRDLRKRQQREQDMWQTWDKQGRKPEDLRPLMHSLQPFLNSQMRPFRRRLRDIPPDVVEAEFQDRLVDGLIKYDPTRGARLNTYLQHSLLPAKRFISTYQNPARIAEARIGGITPLKDATDKLSRRLGRPPTASELSRAMPTKPSGQKWSPGEVRMLRTELRKAYPVGMVGGEVGTVVPSRDMQIMRLLPYDLSSEEKKVFNFVYGRGGSPQLGTNDIAKRLGMSAPKVSRLKRKIADKWKKYSG